MQELESGPSPQGQREQNMTPTDRNNVRIAFLGLGAWVSCVATALTHNLGLAVLSGVLLLGLVGTAWRAR